MNRMESSGMNGIEWNESNGWNRMERVESSRIESNRVEWNRSMNGVEIEWRWNGVSRVEWSGVNRVNGVNGIEWNRVESSGMSESNRIIIEWNEWNRVNGIEWNGIESSGMESSGIEWKNERVESESNQSNGMESSD